MAESGLQLIKSAQEKLARGFYVDNLKEVADLMKQAALSDQSPSACFVVHTVLLSVAEDWDRPVSTIEVEKVDAQLRPLVSDVLDHIAKNASADKVSSSLDSLVKGLLHLSD